jgi:hypothetical protein
MASKLKKSKILEQTSAAAIPRNILTTEETFLAPERQELVSPAFI